MHERPIAFRNGLVDPTSLLEFMTSCHCSELDSPRTPGSCISEYHHLYFPIDAYKSANPRIAERVIRNSMYNQVEMLSCQEDLYHQRSAAEVPRDLISSVAVETYMEEDGWLTDYAATSWGLAATRMQFEHLDMAISKREKARLGVRLALLQELNNDALDRVGRIDVMAFGIVTGAVQKYCQQQPETGITDLVIERLGASFQPIPTRIYRPNALRATVDGMISRKAVALNWAIRKLLLPEQPEPTVA